MKDKISLPSRSSARGLLDGLFAQSVTVKELDAPSDEEPATLAVYRTDDEQIAAVSVASIAVAACTGAALGMIPIAAAEDAVKSGNLPENLRDGFYEVVNICASLMSTDDVHVRLTSLDTDPSSFCPEAKSVLSAPSARIDFLVSVADGTGGMMAFLLP